MNRSGLGRYGVGKTVLREKTTDADDYLICPECGHPVGDSLGTHEVAHPEIVEGADPEVVGDALVTHGWKCDNHSGYEVVMPTPVGSSDAASVVHPGWVGVRVRMADRFVRTIPAPRKEVRATRRGDVDKSSTDAVDAEERGSA